MADEVFEGCLDTCVIKTVDDSASHCGRECRIFSERLFDAAPSRLHTKVGNRRERYLTANGSELGTDGVRNRPGECWVPATR
jgi:hypothetical protein